MVKKKVVKYNFRNVRSQAKTVRKKIRAIGNSRVFAAQSFSFDATASRNGNWRSRCGCDQFSTCNTLQSGQSYITINNQSGRYKIKVYINSYGREVWGKLPTFDQRWNAFVNGPSSYIRYRSGIIEPRGAGGGYFQSGNNDTFNGQAGTLGIEIFDRNNNRVNRILWYSQTWGTWGTKWLRCGHDYTFNFYEV
ncbi:hypothetical protein [Paenibacillus methanolicus]|uniref:Uncharacterized protein n=1 Tax=Paenibacillus methanolicus TaxID=582686 RepID=A0A5S5BK91_9BACL|nr:hypothetical protein [Paenibacillus methanolicus]TYP67384.1 hypothetical protein BCM02_1242 [Paenibacillus methanolicus]